MSNVKAATKADLVQAVVDRTDVTKAQAKRVIDALPDAFAGLLESHQKLVLSGFLKAVVRPGAVYRNPQTGTLTEPKNAVSVKFSPGFRADLA